MVNPIIVASWPKLSQHLAAGMRTEFSVEGLPKISLQLDPYICVSQPTDT